jgi:GNAT superfamily N-acetyltransferase
MAKGTPQLVATYGERVVGWCDVNPVQRPTMRHSGVLGIGLLPQYRGRDLGEKLMLMTLEAAHYPRGTLAQARQCPRLGALSQGGVRDRGTKAARRPSHGVYHDLMIMGLLFDAGTKASVCRGQAP